MIVIIYISFSIYNQMIYHDYICNKIHVNILEVHLLIYNHVFFSKALQLPT